MRLGRPVLPMSLRLSRFIAVGAPDECWPWMGRRLPNGYGELSASGKGGKHLRAHRVAWELKHGPIPEGLCVLHKCDNRPCCNPAHLFLGTRTDNSDDKVKKGRQARGQRVGSAKLSAVQVSEIRAAAAGGERVGAIARRYGVCHQNVSMIVRRKRWREEEHY